MFIATNALVATLLISQPQPSGPTCQSPPDGATQQLIDCYDEACKEYRAAWHACPDADCRAAVGGEYLLAINACWEEHTRQVIRNSWATLWYAGDEFGVSFDHDIPVGARAFLF
jgi:hypothetical protein